MSRLKIWNAQTDEWEYVDSDGGSQPYGIKRVAVDHTLTPLVTHNLLSWPSSDMALGDLWFSLGFFVTTAFNGTTPQISTYCTTVPDDIIDHLDPSTLSPYFDTYASSGLVGVKERISTGGNGLDPFLAVSAGAFSCVLDDGAGGDPHCTVGAGEFWFLITHKPS